MIYATSTVSPVNNIGSLVDVSLTYVMATTQESSVCPGVCRKQIAKSPTENGANSLTNLVL